jgi:hypothetical protein
MKNTNKKTEFCITTESRTVTVKALTIQKAISIFSHVYFGEKITNIK